MFSFVSQVRNWGTGNLDGLWLTAWDTCGKAKRNWIQIQIYELLVPQLQGQPYTDELYCWFSNCFSSVFSPDERRPWCTSALSGCRLCCCYNRYAFSGRPCCYTKTVQPGSLAKAQPGLQLFKCLNSWIWVAMRGRPLLKFSCTQLSINAVLGKWKGKVGLDPEG